MMNKVFLTDHEIRENLFPFTLTRSAADIRVGILTVREKWERYLGEKIHIREQGDEEQNAILLSANIIPSQQFIDSLFVTDEVADRPDWNAVKIIQFPWHIFLWNDWALRQDYTLITTGRTSEPIPAGTQVINGGDIFIEPGASLSCCILNAAAGPIYIGKNAEIMEGSVVRGPFALCEGAKLKMGTKIYGATTIGPYSIVGGEVKNSVIFGYTNKAHEGYLGDSVLGEWCNLGAGTSTSNLKNNAGELKIWNNTTKEFIASGMSKCGLLMGDYSRAAINTSFNTGTITGVCSNIFGEGLSPKFIPSFSWGTRGNIRYEFGKAMADIENWKKLKNATLTEQEKTRLKLIFEQN